MIVDLLKVWWLYFSLGVKGSYYYIRFHVLKLWYMVFTPKHANYIEDIPKLDKANRDLTIWGLEATASLASLKLFGK